MAAPGDREPFEYGGVEHETSDLVKGAGKNARDVGVSTRHAHGVDLEAGEIDAPRVVPGRPTFPQHTEAKDSGPPAAYDDFAPRDATPPSTTP